MSGCKDGNLNEFMKTNRVEESWLYDIYETPPSE